MDYYKIGQKIRKYRKAYNLSQEQLAERVGISTTHMSHIETGNTKLSLPVLVDIANVLSVPTDTLLFDNQQINKNDITNEIIYILDTCSQEDLYVISDIIRTTKASLEKYK